MARMFPDYLPASPDSAGEQYVFDLLKKSHQTRDWVIFHSLDLPNHISNVCGEIDFVILVPSFGILCLEVKGHARIRRSGGLWFFGAGPEPDERGPFKQAAQAGHSFRKALVSKFPHLSRVSVWSAVCLPFGHLEYESPEWHSWQLIQKADSTADRLPNAILKALKSGFARICETFRLRSSNISTFTRDDVEAVTKAFRGDFEVLMSPKDRRMLELREIKKFTDEQFFVIDGLECADRAYVTGPAGTGKTSLAVETARRQPKASSVLLLCFNTLLGEHLKSELTSCPNVEVFTIHGMMRNRVNQEHFKAARDHAFFQTELPSLFEAAFVEAGLAWKQYDVVLIDEAQDVVCEAFLSSIDVIVKGGLSHGRWRMFGDPQHQTLFNATGSRDWKSLPGNPAPFDIRVNCRNTPSVARYAEMLGPLVPGYSRIRRPDNGITPTLSYYQNEEDQQRQVTTCLSALLNGGFAADDIVILSTREGNSVSNNLESPWRDRLCAAKHAKQGRVRSCTIHAFKGLEAAVILLTDVDPTGLKMSDRLFYVGITRTLQQLHIFVDETARGLLWNSISKASIND